MILITGATGFLGTQILKNCVNTNQKCRVAIRKNKSKMIRNISSSIEIVETVDFFNETEEWYSSLCENIEIIIHCAWYLEPGKYINSNYNLDCLTGSINFFSSAANKGVNKLVGIGTCFEYDLEKGALSIDTPLNPTTLYASSKVSLYYALKGLSKKNNIDFNWCRVFYLYGEGEDDRRLVPYLHKNLAIGNDVELTSGIQIRDFLDVKKASKIIVEVAIQKKYTGPFNVCSGIPISIKQFAENIADIYGRRDLLKFGVRPDNVVDPKIVVGIINEIF